MGMIKGQGGGMKGEKVVCRGDEKVEQNRDGDDATRNPGFRLRGGSYPPKC